MCQRPVMQLGYERALTPAQVQAVILVRPQTLAHAILSHLARGEIKDALHMLINAVRASVSPAVMTI